MRASPRTIRGGLVEAGAFLGGVVLLALFQWPALIAGTTMLRHDHLYWGVPLYGFFAESVAQGRLPLWNPFTHGGEPFYVGLFQLRLLDPTAVLVAVGGRWLGVDLITLYTWDRFVRGVVIGAGSYLVLRLWARHLLTRLSLIPIVLFSSVQWSLVRQMAVAEQFLVAPLVLLFFLRILYLGDTRWRNWLAGALLFGLNLQSYFFSGTAVLLTAFMAGLVLFRRRTLLRIRRRPGLSTRLAVAAAIVLVMLLPSVVLLTETGRFVFPPRIVDYPYEDKAPNQGPPQYEPSGDVRSTRPLLFPYRLQLHIGAYSAPNDFVQLWAPLGNEYASPAKRTWGKPSEAFMYIGMLPLAVALLGMVAGRSPLKRVWMLTLVVVGLLMLGPQAFLHALLYWVFPPLWFARNTHTLVLFFILALLYFYVLGCNRILGAARALEAAAPASGPLAGVLGRPALARLLAALGLTVGVAAAVLTLSRVRYPLTFYTLPVLASVVVLGWWLRADLGRRALYVAIVIGWSAAVGVLSTRAHDRTSAFFLCVFLALPLLAWASWNGRVRSLGRLGVGVAFGAMAILVGHRLMLLAREGPVAFGLTVGPGVALAGAAVCGILLLVVARDVFGARRRVLSRESLAASLALVSALDLVAYSGYLKPLAEGPRPEGVAAEPAAQVGTFPATRAVSAAPPPAAALEQTIRYLDLSERVPAAFSPLVTPSDRPPARSDPAATIDGLLDGQRASTFLMTRGYYDLVRSGARGAALAAIFAVDRPLIQFRREWEWLGPDEARRRLGDAAFVRRSVVLEKPRGAAVEPAEAKAAGDDAGPWRWTAGRYDYNALDLDVEAPARGVLYWADGYDPHWRAWVDGAEVAVHRANLAFKAIFVPPGRHAVRFEYRPTAIVVTGLLFVAMGFAGAILGVWALASAPRLPRFGGRA